MGMQGQSQADKRRDMNLKDQFGRKWLAAIEKESFEPAGHITPAGWTDPLRTPTQYLRVPRDEFSNPQVGQVLVDFKRWHTDQTNAMKEWKVRFYNIGREQKKHAFDPEKDQHDAYVLHLVGEKPWPSPELLVEAAAGKTDRAKMMLGLNPLDQATRLALGYAELEDLEALIGSAKTTPQQDAMAEMEREEYSGEEQSPAAQRVKQTLSAPVDRPVIATTSYKAFSDSCLRRGFTMKQISQLWKDLKKMGAVEGALDDEPKSTRRRAAPEVAEPQLAATTE